MQLGQLTAGATQPYVSQFLVKVPQPIQGLPTNLTERGYIVPDSEGLKQLREARIKALEPLAIQPQLQIANAPSESPTKAPLSPEAIQPTEAISELDIERMDTLKRLKVGDVRALATNLGIPIRYTRSGKSNYFGKQDLVGKIVDQKNQNPSEFNTWIDILS
jgi:hypothetical protein